MTTSHSESSAAPRTTREPCLVHGSRHIPNSHVNHRHHVWPVSLGGPDTPDNIVVVCPTGHANIHTLLNLFRVHRGEPPYTETRQFAFGERELARLGWQRLQRGAL